jgi:hypothetical protein
LMYICLDISEDGRLDGSVAKRILKHSAPAR